VALKRIVIVAALAALAACAPKRTERESSFADLQFARRAEVPAILTLMPDSPSARATYDGMVDELGADFDLVPRIVTRKTSVEELAQIIGDVKPKAIVVMNNPTLRLYRQYQIARPAAKRTPVIAVLTSFLRESSEGVQNLTGVIYEVPLVTSLVNLRTILKQPLKRVGVLHRPIFGKFIEEQRKLAQTEGFELVGIEVSGKKRSEIREGLRDLRNEKGVDAIWVLNDNVLLDREMLRKGWLPALRRNRTPVVVNVRSLLSRDVDFGTFAVLPDHNALGTQAGQLIGNIAATNWQVDGAGFEYPLSVEKVLDVTFARRYLEIEEQQLATIDQLVE
jgi:vacuolar-type H+-ATPase subunit F/Vma7